MNDPDKNTVDKDNKKILDTEIHGIYQNNQVWVLFDDNSRKFYEKSYYGLLYNEQKEELLSSHSILKKDINNESFVISEEENLPKSKKPYYIVLDPIEALYLIERKKLFLKDEQGHDLLFNDLIERGMEKDSRIWQKYIVYRDIRHRGYIIRIGYSGKADFRVYARGAKFSKDTSKYVFFIIQDGIPVALDELDATVKQVLGDRKELILAIFDKLGDSTFYELENYTFANNGTFEERWNQKAKVSINNPNMDSE